MQNNGYLHKATIQPTPLRAKLQNSLFHHSRIHISVTFSNPELLSLSLYPSLKDSSATTAE